MIWLRIAGSPPRQFYATADALPHLVAGEARHELLRSVGTIRSDVEGESPNVSVELRNESGQCTALFALPPIGAVAELLSEDGPVFVGVLHDISLDATSCTLGIEA